MSNKKKVIVRSEKYHGEANNSIQHDSLEDAIESDRLERKLLLQSSESSSSHDEHADPHVPKAAVGPHGDDLCPRCLGDSTSGSSGCMCDMQDEVERSVEKHAGGHKAQPSLQRLRKRKPSEIEDLSEYAFVWYFDTRKSYKPWWADDYLRLPPYQFHRAPAPDQEAEGDSGGSRRDYGSNGSPQEGQGEGPSPRAPPLSHVRYSGSEEGGLRSSFKRERIRERQAAAKNRAYSARARFVSQLYGQLFKGNPN